MVRRFCAVAHTLSLQILLNALMVTFNRILTKFNKMLILLNRGSTLRGARAEGARRKDTGASDKVGVR
jgi:hypothetical protein